MITEDAATLAARVTPPELEDTSRFVKIANVPILDVHTRTHTTDAWGKPCEPYTTSVDEDQLKRIYENTLAKFNDGYPPLARVGHVRKNAPETAQPPRVGYVKPKGVAAFKGRPTILADFYMDREVDLHERGTKDYRYVLDQFPRRSVEVFRKTGPDGFIDAVAFLTRKPEREGLGLVTYGGGEVEVFECQCEHEEGGSMGLEDGKQAADDTAEAAAIEKIVTAMVAKLIAHEGFHANMASKIAPMIAEKVSADIGNKIHEAMREALESHAEDDGEPGTGGGTGDEDTDDHGGLEGEKPSEPPGTEDSVGADHDADDDDGPPSPPPSMGSTHENEEEDMAANEELILEIGVMKTRLDAALAENETLKTRLSAVETFAADQQRHARDLTRRSSLESLAAQGYEIDVNEELESFADAGDDAFNAHLSRIQKKYVRSIAGAVPVQTARLSGKVNNPSAAQSDDVEPFSAEDRRAVAELMNDGTYVQKRGESAAAYGARVVADYMKRKKAGA